MDNNDKIFMYGALCLVSAAIIWLFYSLMVGPTSVSINSKEFTCTDAEPIGISSRCVNYHRVGR